MVVNHGGMTRPPGVERSSVFGHIAGILLFSLQFGEFTFHELPRMAFRHRAWQRRCNDAGARHRSIQRTPLGKPVSVLPTDIAPFSLRHCSIFSAVNDSPHREALFSGRFLKGHWAICSAWSAAVRLGRRSLSTKCGSFHRNERGRCSGLYTEPG
jgi:hypothetical protein